MIFSTIAKLQGKNKWPTATATVSAIKIVSEGYRGSCRKITFTYRGETNDVQIASLNADNTTALYNIQRGETFDVRYNPKNPTRTYTDEAVNFGADFRVVFWLCVVVFVLITVTITLLKKL